MVIRFLIEANNPKSDALGHGRCKELADEIQQYEFKRAFIAAKDIFSKYRKSPTYFAFNPYAEIKSVTGIAINPFENYLPKRDDKLVADCVGINVFNLYPGKGMFDRPKYWTFGYQTPEEVLIPSLTKLNQLVDERVIRVNWEVAQVIHDPEYLRKLVIVSAALGVSGFMHLNFDKSYLGLDYEAKWNMTPEEMQAYRDAIALVNKQNRR
jgi:hypothetical protein